MTEKFCRASITKQQKHVFLQHAYDFSHDESLFIRRLEIHPARMGVQRGGIYAPKPGDILVNFRYVTGFDVRTERDIRMAIRKRIEGELGMPPQGSVDQDWFTFGPQNGVVTPKMVQDTLTALQYVTVLTNSGAMRAMQTFGIQDTASPVRPQDTSYISYDKRPSV